MKSKKRVVHLDSVSIFIFFILFYTSQNTILFGTNNNNIYIKIGEIIMVLSLGILLILVGRKIPFCDWCKWFIMNISVGMTVIVNNDFQLNHFFVMLALGLGLAFSYYVSLNQFVVAYNKCLSVLCAYSLVIMFIALIIPSILSVFPKITNLSGYKFFNLILSMVPTDYSTDIYRNYSIFREPGVFQYYLCLGILFEFIYMTKTNKKRVLLFVVTLITTFSTTGYIAAVIVLGIVLLRAPNIKKQNKIIAIFLALLVSLYLVFFTSILDTSAQSGYSVLGKLNGIRDIRTKGYMLNSSLVMRIGSILVNFYLFCNNWILGLGLKNLYTEYVPMSIKILGVPIEYSTDGLVLQFAKYGVLFGGILVYGYYRLSSRLAKYKFVSWLLFLFFIVQLLSENYSNDIILYVMLWYGLKENGKKHRCRL